MSNWIDQVLRVARKYEIGVTDLSELPMLAATLLQDTVTDAGLAELASMSRHDPDDELECKLRTLLVESGIAWPTGSDLYRDAFWDYISDIAEGTVDPLTGSTIIWKKIFWKLGAPEVEFAAGNIVGLAVFADEHPDIASQVARQIRVEAQRIIAGRERSAEPQ